MEREATQTFLATDVGVTEDPDIQCVTAWCASRSSAGAPECHLLFTMPISKDPTGPDHDFYVEFNDQGNGRFPPDLEAVELTSTTLRVRYAAGRPVFGGRIDHPDAGRKVSEVVAVLRASPDRIEALRAFLQKARRYGCPFLYQQD